MPRKTPSNPLMRITDIERLADGLRERGVLLSVDATMMTPLLMRPLHLGADLVVHSGTKFFSGHADAMGGMVLVRDKDLAQTIAFHQNAEGSALAPFDCWLFLRGIKTMAIRVERACESAAKVAAFLVGHPAITKVYWSGNLKDIELHAGSDAAKRAAADGASKDKFGIPPEQLEVHRQQARGAAPLISFETGDLELSKRFCEACKILKITVSFGSVNSLCELPCAMSHASIPSGMRTLPPDLVRISIGIEDARDIIDDISQALDRAVASLAAERVEAAGEEEEEEEEEGATAAAAAAAAAATTAATAATTVAPLQTERFDSKFEDLPVVPEAPAPSTTAAAAAAAVTWTATDRGNEKRRGWSPSRK